MALLITRAKANTTATGTGAVTPGTAVTNFQTWSAAGATSGRLYSYLIEDGTAWEVGVGLYNGTTITRPGPTTDPQFASSTGSLLSLSGFATIACVGLAANYNQFDSVGVPLLSSFTQTNLTGVTTTENPGSAIGFSAAGAAGSNLALITRAAPTPPYRIVAATSWFGASTTGNFACGVCFRDSVSGKIQNLYALYISGALGWSIESWNSATSFSGSPTRMGAQIDSMAKHVLSLRDDGTNIYFDLGTTGSGNNGDYFTVYSVAKASGFLGSSGYNQCGFVISTSNATSSNHITASLTLWDENGANRLAFAP